MFWNAGIDNLMWSENKDLKNYNCFYSERWLSQGVKMDRWHLFMFSQKVIVVVISLGCHGNVLDVTQGQRTFTEMLSLADLQRCWPHLSATGEVFHRSRQSTRPEEKWLAGQKHNQTAGSSFACRDLHIQTAHTHTHTRKSLKHWCFC